MLKMYTDFPGGFLFGSIYRFNNLLLFLFG